MAAHVIGLDIGTNAVRAVELSLGRGRPTVRKMGQVALPPGVVVAGEVVDTATVSSALRRLWKETGFSGRSVVVGVANQRVVARMAEFPAMPEDELRASLPFQVQDLIPIPVDEAQLDIQIIDRMVSNDGQEQVRVLLVAAHRDMLRSLLAALQGANLSATRIDLVPFALIRALYDPAEWMADGSPVGGQEVIIGVGAGVTNVVVHEQGVPRFVRTLPAGGDDVTEALMAELGVDFDEAESIKRGVVPATTQADLSRVDELAMSAVGPLVSEVAGSLDFHLAQAGERELRRAVVSGGGARLRAVGLRLEDQLGVPVVSGDPFAGVAVGKVGLAPEVLAASADLFTVAIGLALSGQSLDGQGRRISLLPAEISVQRAARRQAVMAGAGVGAFAILLLGLAYLRGAEADRARADAIRSEEEAAVLQTEVAALSDVEGLEADVAQRSEVVRATLTGDVSWPELLQEITALLPNDVWLTSFNGTRGVAGAPGTVTVAANGLDHTSTAKWLLRLGELDALEGLWVPSSTKSAGGAGQSTVTFSSDATLTPAAESNRADEFVGDAR